VTEWYECGLRRWQDDTKFCYVGEMVIIKWVLWSQNCIQVGYIGELVIRKCVM